jgi:hypothetical protein
MILWGGFNVSALNSGGVYDPVSNGWSVTPGGANNPAARELHTAVWSGSEMLVWGGIPTPGLNPLNTGARFSLATNSWTPIPTGSFVPAARGEHSAVWTGSEMIVWGGDNPSYLNSGGRYDMTTNIWTPTSTGANVPGVRASHTAVWDRVPHGRLGGIQRLSDPRYRRPLRSVHGHVDHDLPHRRSVPPPVPHRGVDGERDDRLGRR